MSSELQGLQWLPAVLPAAVPQGQAVFESRSIRVTHSFESHSVSVYAAPCSVLYWRVGGASIFPQGRHAARRYGQATVSHIPVISHSGCCCSSAFRSCPYSWFKTLGLRHSSVFKICCLFSDSHFGRCLHCRPCNHVSTQLNLANLHFILCCRLTDPVLVLGGLSSTIWIHCCWVQHHLRAEGGGSQQLYYHDCSGRIPGHTTRAPPVGFEQETNGFQFYAIANLDISR